MAEQVVSSRFGKRPLLEVPPMQVSHQVATEVPSLQAPVVNYISNNPFPLPVANTVPNPALYNPNPAMFPTGSLPFGTGLQRNFLSAPAGPWPATQGPTYFYGPNGELVAPIPSYHNRNVYPGVVNPASGYVPPPPLPPPVRIAYPDYSLPNPGFNITCELEYGRVTNIDVRDSIGEFRGIPEFLKAELVRTYGSYPYTKVTIRLEGGQFHIYATHERRRRRGRRRRHDSDSDTDSDYYNGAPYPEWKSEVDSYTSGVRPRNPGDRPRGIIHERGWNRYR